MGKLVSLILGKKFTHHCSSLPNKFRLLIFDPKLGKICPTGRHKRVKYRSEVSRRWKDVQTDQTVPLVKPICLLQDGSFSAPRQYAGVSRHPIYLCAHFNMVLQQICADFFKCYFEEDKWTKDKHKHLKNNFLSKGKIWAGREVSVQKIGFSIWGKSNE